MIYKCFIDNTPPKPRDTYKDIEPHSIIETEKMNINVIHDPILPNEYKPIEIKPTQTRHSRQNKLTIIIPTKEDYTQILSDEYSSDEFDIINNNDIAPDIA